MPLKVSMSEVIFAYPTLKRTLRAIRSHVARATAYGAPVNRAEIANALGVTLSVYEKRFSLIKAILGIRL